MKILNDPNSFNISVHYGIFDCFVSYLMEIHIYLTRTFISDKQENRSKMESKNIWDAISTKMTAQHIQII